MPTLNVSFLFGVVVLASCLDSAETTEATSNASTDSQRVDVIECRTDDACPRGSYCESGICFTSSRCYVDGRPSDAFCERTYGEGFVCYEYAPDSHHCVPTE
jgi:hypothetical protein